jgi:hypothetical protein
MQYLFFDLEYASCYAGKKICEFGYVITNEKLEVIKRDNIIINPNISKYDWDPIVVNKIITRSIDEYESGYLFNECYEQIKKIILSCDKIFGHTLDSDASALDDECLRYHLPSIDFDFYDIKLFYKRLTNTSKDVGVVDMLNKLNVKGEINEHDAETDAYNTMLDLKGMLNVLDVTLDDLITLCPDVIDRNENYLVFSLKDSIEGENDVSLKGKNRKILDNFIKRVKPQGIKKSTLKDMNIVISRLYEAHHFHQTLNLVQLITNEGGKVRISIPTCNTYMTYFGNDEEDDGLFQCELLKEEGKKIDLITLEELLNKLSITEEELDQLNLVDLSKMNSLENEEVYSLGGEKKTTLGDLYGDYFAKLLEDIDE